MIRWIITALIVVFGPPAMAQTSWPERPLRIVVPYAPGGAVDIVARLVAQQMSIQFQQPVVVDNKPGAGSLIGNEFVTRASPDGYTLLVNSSFALAGPNEDRTYRVDELRHVSVLAGAVYALVTGGNSNYRTLRDLVQAAKRTRIGTGADGIQSQSFIAISTFGVLNGIDLAPVPYRGSAQLITELASGQIDIAALPVGATRAAGSSLRPLAVMDSKRSPFSPETPTLKELGFGDFHVSSYYMLAVPAGTPAPIRSRIAAAAVRAVRAPDVVARLQSMDLDPYGAEEDLAESVIAAERDFYTKMGKPGAPPALPRPPALAAVAPPALTGAAEWRQRSAALSPTDRERANDKFRSAFEYLRAGNSLMAATTFASGLEIDPGNASARFYHGEALLLARNIEQAIVQWRAARDLAPGTSEGQKAVERLRENGR